MLYRINSFVTCCEKVVTLRYSNDSLKKFGEILKTRDFVLNDMKTHALFLANSCQINSLLSLLGAGTDWRKQCK